MTSRSSSDPLVVAFGDAVRVRREEVGMTQEELGLAADLHRTYIGKIERGEGELGPTLGNMGKLARALRTTLRELLPEEDAA